MKKKIILLSSLFLFIDIVSKILFNFCLILGKSYPIMEKFLYLTLTYNEGVSFSMFEGRRLLIILFSALILVFLIVYMQKFKENKRNILAFSLVFGGLLGNLFDRVVYGHVIDFIDFYIFGYNFPVFNFADTFICIGIMFLLYAVYKGEDNENKRN